MGNESGDQVIGRRYFHDLYKVDLQEMHVQKLWDISEGQPNVVPVQDMLIQNDSCFYVLRYPESVSNSFCVLYRFLIKMAAVRYWVIPFPFTLIKSRQMLVFIITSV